MILLTGIGLLVTGVAMADVDWPIASDRKLVPDYLESERRAGGEATVYSSSRQAYNAPAAYLSSSGKLDYFSGHSFFNSPWVSAPASTTARDGLGPLFNANSCNVCHIRNGRGSVAQESLTLLLAQPADDHYSGDSLYGPQLQLRAVMGLEPEGQFDIGWRQYNIMQADGSTVNLRAPQFRILNWSMGKPDPGTRWSARIAPPLIGLGLLESIPVRQVLENADYQNSINNSISGRPSWVKDRMTGHKSLGRFGWKATQPTIRQQSAKAFSQDLGLTSSLYPESVCTERQADCLHRRSGEQNIEVSDVIMDIVSYFMSNGAVPAPRNTQSAAFKRGREQFYHAGCAQCHKPHWRTRANAQRPAQDIWPYTDLLLHDMGSGLAAPVGEGGVSGAEWRTPPLWGIGLAKIVNPATGYLHDGRARSLLEAILWHGGEGEASRQAVRLMSAADRDDLLYFLESL